VSFSIIEIFLYVNAVVLNQPKSKSEEKSRDKEDGSSSWCL